MSETEEQKIENARIVELASWREVGEHFNFNGVKCVVVSHVVFEERFIMRRMGQNPLSIPFSKAVLNCRYVDLHGRIRAVKFNYDELNGLIKQNLGTI